ncbi:hypothetical protein CCO03_00310 [Comamonas serinivorans]|uniref:Guanylate cyclase domain-containing protein n=1 Tax=Comamonas serinivorans TaxID=1082851 RepID=A0A1Y0EIA7_9BURK|nr:adenylate/guanylate cyclase domain-containing protein [Comamonas serinivorans]ARU03337.1 hypothetical protein CCO03_00310 [Comamonas serinivorans]
MTRRNRDRLRMVLCLLPLALLLAHVQGWLHLPAVDRLDERLYDMRMLGTMPHTLDERVVIVDVDEASLSRIGHWPWSRNRVAQLIDELLNKQQVRAIGIDMVFAEADHSSGLAQLRRLLKSEPSDRDLAQWLAAITPELDFDGQLANAIQQRPVVLGYYFSSDGEPRIGQLPAPVFSQSVLPTAPTPRWSGYGANIVPLAEAATAAGFFNAITDPDGLVRTVPLLARYEGGVYESLALATYRLAVGPSQLLLEHAPSGALSALRVTDPQGRVLSRLRTSNLADAYIPFRGPGGPQGGSFRYVSAASLLLGELPPGELAGRIVLIGSTAPGLQDVRATPVAGTYPGVEVHANLISAMLDSRLPQQPDYVRGYEVSLLLLVSGLLILLPRVLQISSSVALHLGLPLALFVLDGWAFHAQGLILPLASALTLIVCLTVINLLFGYLMESRDRRQLMRVFGTYVPPELVQEMVKRPDAYSMQASSRELTVMFCDLQDFTRLSEHLDPTEVQVLLNNLFTHLTEVIYAHGGTVDKYMGDCVMAFWGAPMTCEDHADRATHAAMAIQERIKTLNAARRIEGRDPLRICIGINTGIMAVGDMGSNWRRSYTVIGDSVNLASRLEALTRVYGFNIVVGERTSVLSFEFLWQHIDRVQVKGRAQLEDIYAPVSLMTRASAELVAEIDAWNEALAAHLDGDDVPMRTFLLAAHTDSGQKLLYDTFAARLSLPRSTSAPAGLPS